MNKKQLRDIAIVIIIVFIVTIVVYPLIFSTDAKPNAGAPVELPAAGGAKAPN